DHWTDDRGDWCRSWALAPLAYVGFDLQVEQVERQGSIFQDGRVKIPYVEPVAQSGARLIAKFQEAELTDHVARRLSGIVEIALHLLRRVTLQKETIFAEIGNGLLAGPSMVMDPRV